MIKNQTNLGERREEEREKGEPEPTSFAIACEACTTVSRSAENIVCVDETDRYFEFDEKRGPEANSYRPAAASTALYTTRMRCAFTGAPQRSHTNIASTRYLFILINIHEYVLLR